MTLNPSFFIYIFCTTLLLASCAPKKEILDKEQARAFYELGNYTFDHKDYRRAALMYDKAYHLDRGDLKSLLALGKTQSCLGAKSETIVTYEKVLARDKNNQKALEALGALHYARGQINKALHYWSLLLYKDSSNSAGLNGLGFLLTATGQLSEGEYCFNKALVENPDNPLLLNNLGLNLALQGFVLRGEEKIKKAYQLEPRSHFKNNINLVHEAEVTRGGKTLIYNRLHEHLLLQNINSYVAQLKQLGKQWCKIN